MGRLRLSIEPGNVVRAVDGEGTTVAVGHLEVTSMIGAVGGETTPMFVVDSLPEPGAGEGLPPSGPVAPPPHHPV